MSEAVTVPSLMMIILTVSEESLAKDTHTWYTQTTHTHTHRHGLGSTFKFAKSLTTKIRTINIINHNVVLIYIISIIMLEFNQHYTLLDFKYGNPSKSLTQAQSDDTIILLHIAAHSRFHLHMKKPDCTSSFQERRQTHGRKLQASSTHIRGLQVTGTHHLSPSSKPSGETRHPDQQKPWL